MEERVSEIPEYAGFAAFLIRFVEPELSVKSSQRPKLCQGEMNHNLTARDTHDPVTD